MTTNSGFHKGQIGAKIILDTLDDPILLASADIKEIWYRNSLGSGKFTATLEGTNFIYTTTAASDLPVVGTYSFQTHAEGSEWNICGNIVRVKVEDKLQ